MIKTENGRFVFEPKDAKIEQRFEAAVAADHGARMAMHALVGTMGRVHEATRDACEGIRVAMVNDGVWPKDTPQCASICHDAETGEIYFKGE